MDDMTLAVYRNRHICTETARAFCKAAGVAWEPNRNRAARMHRNGERAVRDAMRQRTGCTSEARHHGGQG